MKLCRFDDDRLGLVEGDIVVDVTPALDDLPRVRYPLPHLDLLVAHLGELRARIDSLAAQAPRRSLAKVQMLSPVANPGKIIAAPVNYLKHLEEVLADKGIHHGNPILEIQRAGLFLKASSSLVGAGQGVALTHTDRRNDHEVELAVVIGKQARKVAAKDALGYVAGYCIGLDITIRGPEERSLRKSPDSYTVLGPWLVTADELTDPSQLDISIRVNDQLRQSANTDDMVIDVPGLIEFASSFYTLHPGDVILTGTPQGVGPIQPGDSLLAEIGRIGRMRVQVRKAD
ncbi:MAG: fumarylacetoacetate hydrolase family protein [Betaproteobacteria bacterium]|nr:fumarylacetoacetate hydrolase family protein [Betaproteobacteria bacterium]